VLRDLTGEPGATNFTFPRWPSSARSRIRTRAQISITTRFIASPVRAVYKVNLMAYSENRVKRIIYQEYLAKFGPDVKRLFSPKP
jgi:hypothetical protein